MSEELMDKVFGPDPYMEEDSEVGEWGGEDYEEDDYDPELSHYLKYDYDGSATIEELILRFQAQIEWFQEKLNTGWSLSQPVESSWCHFNKPQETPASGPQTDDTKAMITKEQG